MPTQKTQTRVLLLRRIATFLLAALLLEVVSSCSAPHGSGLKSVKSAPTRGPEQKRYANKTVALSFATEDADSSETHRYQNNNYANETISVSFELSDPAALPK